MPRSSIDLHFNELTDVLEPWRMSVEVASLGVPPHITLLYPWRKSPLKVSDLNELEHILNNVEPFELCFERVATFDSGVVYLSLREESKVRKLMQKLFKRFPDTPPYGGAFTDPRPHLTVAKCPPEQLPKLQTEIAEALELPIVCQVANVVAMEEQSDKTWTNRRIIELNSA